jgi:hypothetical protein
MEPKVSMVIASITSRVLRGSNHHARYEKGEYKSSEWGNI